MNATLRDQRDRANPPSYLAVHKRLARERGKASEHLCPCGERADEWSYNGTDSDELVSEEGWVYSRDSGHYTARCRSCHRRKDGSYYGRQTHCKNNHEFDERNTYYSDGRRSCRACNRRAAAMYAARQKGAVE